MSTVAIIGGGFSGAMLAARLAERGIASRLINSTADFGLGVAYSTTSPVHLLNVRSSRMSAVADAPDHFVRWLEAHHPTLADPTEFAPRRVYGAYVQARLAEVSAAHPGLIEQVVGEAVEIARVGVRLADGRVIAADTVVLATGNPAPRTVPGAKSQSAATVIADPWAPGALEAVRPSDHVAIIGTGLTMVDVLLSLEDRGWVGRATTISRRGLAPRAHGPVGEAATPVPGMLAGPLSHRLGAARAGRDDDNWRDMMDGLRSITASVWGDATEAEQARFLRHLRPWWDVHRHRLAPRIAAALTRLEAGGRLDICPGRIARVTSSPTGVSIRWRRRGETAERTLVADRLIDCTGPGYAPEAEPVTAGLLVTGRARLHPLRLGLDVDDQGRVLDADGRPDNQLLVLGPPARAAFWETVAVPDIRERMEQIVALVGCSKKIPR